jgi:hypothetical protein
MIRIILFIPFIIEAFGDAYLITHGKKDISWKVRILMIIVVVLVFVWTGGRLREGVFLSLAPFAFFDPILNVIRFRSLKKWSYIGKTKFWDRTIQFWKDHWLKDWMIVLARVVFFSLCLLEGLK